MKLANHEISHMAGPLTTKSPLMSFKDQAPTTTLTPPPFQKEDFYEIYLSSKVSSVFLDTTSTQWTIGKWNIFK